MGAIGTAGPGTSGGAADAAKTASHKDFPNQQSKPRGCAPTGVSNSLKWLKAKQGLNLPDDKISPAALATALHQDVHTTGVKIFGENGFVDLKQKYMTELKANVVTSTSTDWAAILKAVKDGKDVELECKGHTVAVTGVSDLGGGKYAVDIAHDTDQKDDAKGTIVERVTFDTATGKFKDGTWITGHGLNYAVIESVPEPSTVAVLGLGVLTALRRRKRQP